MSNTLRVVLAVLIILICIGLFIFTYYLNRKTPKPDGCENMDGQCEGCQMTSCSHYIKNNEEGEEK